MSKVPEVSIVIVGWNSLAHLRRCLPSLFAKDLFSFGYHYPKTEIIVVDNASTDGTAHWLATTYPTVRLLRNRYNQGFAAAVNQGFLAAHGDILVELNPDTVVTPNWLTPLVAVVQEPGVGLATPRVMLMSNPHRINACGNEISFTGLTFCHGAGEPAEQFRGSYSVAAISGAAFAMTRLCYDTIGGFDPDYFTYYEDTDLSIRARLAGFNIRVAGESVVYHDYEFRFSPQKIYWIERNRHITFLKCFGWMTFFRLIPALLLGEVVSWSYAFLKGPSTVWAKVCALVWVVLHMDEIWLRRQRTQRMRVVDDQSVLDVMTPAIRFDLARRGVVTMWLTATITSLLNWWMGFQRAKVG